MKVPGDAIEDSMRLGAAARLPRRDGCPEIEMDHEKHSPTRRAVIGDIAIGLAAGTWPPERSLRWRRPNARLSFWHGLRRRLVLSARRRHPEKQGHKVFAPTLLASASVRIS
jgi:hypothetical protein